MQLRPMRACSLTWARCQIEDPSPMIASSATSAVETTLNAMSREYRRCPGPLVTGVPDQGVAVCTGRGPRMLVCRLLRVARDDAGPGDHGRERRPAHERPSDPRLGHGPGARRG